MDMFSHALIMEEIMLSLVPALASSIPSFAFSVATYVLSALALYTVADRRGISKPWLSWIPVLNVWILGSLSDQYRYVVKGQIKSKRKALLILNIINLIISVSILVIAIVLCVQGIEYSMMNVSEDVLLEMILGPVLAIVGLCLPLMGIAIALMVIRYMALYDLYTSMDPANNVLFLVLSIIFSFTEPFFLFFNRNKDTGMPPRKEESVPVLGSSEPDYL